MRSKIKGQEKERGMTTD